MTRRLDSVDRGRSQVPSLADWALVTSIAFGTTMVAVAFGRGASVGGLDLAQVANLLLLVVGWIAIGIRSRLSSNVKATLVWALWTLAAATSLLRFGLAANGILMTVLAMLTASATLTRTVSRLATTINVALFVTIAGFAAFGQIDAAPSDAQAFVQSPASWWVAVVGIVCAAALVRRFLAASDVARAVTIDATSPSATPRIDNAASAASLLDMHDEGHLDASVGTVFRTVAAPVVIVTIGVMLVTNLLQLILLGRLNPTDLAIGTIIPLVIAPPVVGWLVWQNRRLSGTFGALDRMRAATREAIYDAMANLALLRDRETGDHLRRCSAYATALHASCVELGVEGAREVDAPTLAQAVRLHDIGKIGIPDSILLKPGRLDADETRTMQEHARMGSDLIVACQQRNDLEEDDVLSMAREIALGHHEQWDGAGYPLGRSTTSIPLPARLMAIIDVYDALRSERPYKAAMTATQALDVMRTMKATKFDPDVFAAFERIAPTFASIFDGDGRVAAPATKLTLFG